MTNLSSSLDSAFQALADPTRRAVLNRLARGPASVSELARPFDMAMPSFMQHLRVLERGGLIRTRKQGRVRTCEFVPEKVEIARDWLAEQRVAWEGRLDRFDAYVEAVAESEAAGKDTPT